MFVVMLCFCAVGKSDKMGDFCNNDRIVGTFSGMMSGCNYFYYGRPVQEEYFGAIKSCLKNLKKNERTSISMRLINDTFSPICAKNGTIISKPLNQFDILLKDLNFEMMQDRDIVHVRRQ